MLDLNQVALFVEVVRSGSFAAAARRLGMPPNTVSRQVQALEDSLQHRLLHRSTRKLTLTLPGQTFYDRCAGSVADISQAGQDLSLGGQLPAGRIRVAAPADFINASSIGWIGEFIRTHPQVRIEFVLSDARADLIDEGIDLAFRASHLEDSKSIARQLFNHHFILVASPAYVAERGMPLGPQDLKRHDCLVQRSNTRRSGAVSWKLHGEGETVEVTVDGRLSANTAGAVLQAALSGLGIALLPAMVAAPHVSSGALVRVLPAYQRDGGGMQAVLPSRKQVPRAVSAFVEFAAARVQRELENSTELARIAPPPRRRPQQAIERIHRSIAKTSNV